MFPILRSRLAPIVLAAAVAFPQSALSQSDPDPTCAYGDLESWSDAIEAYAGAWTVNHHSGFMITQGFTLPFGASNEADSVDIIAVSDGSLILDSPEVQNPLFLEWADEPPWRFEGDAEADGVPEPMLSSTDIELLRGCPNTQMARLIGTTTATVEGVTMDFTYRLMITGETNMFGVMHMTAMAAGQPMNIWRTVSLSR